MKNFKFIIGIVVLASTLSHFSANSQVRKFTFTTASGMLNTSTAASGAAPKKSSFTSGSSVASTDMVVQQNYDRKVKISYQLPAVHALEWVLLKIRAVDAYDSNPGKFAEMSQQTQDALNYLYWSEFRKLSDYSSVTVKFDCRFNKVIPYKSKYYIPQVSTPVVSTKTLFIKK
jgi:hypothetical protein